MYEFNLWKPDGSEKWQLPYEKITVTEELNKGVDGMVSIAYDAIEDYAAEFGLTPDGLCAAAARTWEIVRDGVPLQNGILMHRRITMGSTGPTYYQLNFAGWLQLLAKRRTALYNFEEAEDSAVIAWNEIDTTNSDPSGYGDTLIRLGLSPTTKDRQRTMRYDNIRDLIVGMSNEKVADGYDFDIDMNRDINFYYPKKGQNRPEIVIDNFRYLNGSIDRPLQGSLSNRLHVLGSGSGSDMVTATVEDTTPMATWGLLTDIVSEKGVGDEDELEDRGNQALNESKTPKDEFSITISDDDPDLSTYNVGDTVTVLDDRIGITVQRRIIKRKISISRDSKATIILGFEKEST